jgi:hypothetical protein
MLRRIAGYYHSGNGVPNCHVDDVLMDALRLLHMLSLRASLLCLLEHWRRDKNGSWRSNVSRLLRGG